MNGMEKAKNKRVGKAAAVVGLLCNLLLAGAKIAAGLLTGLLSVAADGFNNLSDCGSCTVALIALRVSEKPADREHPFGHQRTEYIATLCIAVFILALSVELFKESVENLLSPPLTEGNLWVYLLLGISVAVKFGMFFLYRYAAARADSESLKASATDSACDCLATAVAFAGALITQKTGFSADGWAGLLLALFIAFQALGLLKEASSSLLGRAPDPALVASLKELALSQEGVLGLHDLRIYSYGKSHLFATVHIEMSAEIAPLKAHEALDLIEREAKERLGVELTAHLDPVAINDGEMLALGQRVKAAAKEIDQGLDVHDFRLVRGAVGKCVFEVGVPYACPLTDDAIHDALFCAVKKFCGYELLFTVERQ